MTTENSKLSPPNVDAPSQMRGWFKLIETIRQTEPPPNELFKSSPDSQTNGYPPKSPEPVPIDSPTLISSPPLISSSPIDIEPKIKATVPKRRSTRHKKITIRKSTRSKEIQITPDEDITPLYTHQQKHPSSDSSSVILFATDLRSLPGHNQDELRDQRFLNYSDFNTLSTHLHTCLYIDKKPFPSSYFSKQHIFKTRHNILTKIFKLSYQKSSIVDQKIVFDEELSSKTPLSSSTSTTFKTDWSVNRRNASSHRYEPKNVFHILQLTPKTHLFSSMTNQSPRQLSIEDQHHINYEHMKDVLIRTYYPHFHTAFQSGYYFGAKSKVPINHQNSQLTKESEVNPDMNQSLAITPPSIFQRPSKKRGRKPKHRKREERPLPLASSERRVSEEIPSIDVPISTKIPSSPVGNHNCKRKISITINSPTNERKKKQIASIPSPEISFEDQDLSYSDSDDDDVLPDVLPAQNFIKNGLRSNYYKSIVDPDSKSTSNKNRSTRRHPQSSGSLPPFYTGLFESTEEKFFYINYRLPFDIYWFNQRQVPTSIKSLNPPNKKKQISYKNFSRNTPTNTTVPVNLRLAKQVQNGMKIEELTADEKEIVSRSSRFLKRNLRRIKEKHKRKDTHQQEKQQIDESAQSLFFAQNYYHHSQMTNETEPVNVSHKDLLNLFVNHIRRSHFAKISRCSIEQIDRTCSYAQLAQLTIILNEIFQLLLNYKCQNRDIYPSNALKKCPSKRLFPMYYELISKPLDLTIIRNKLDHGDYLTYQSFEDDFLLLFTNAITYCGVDSDVGRAVNELERYFLHRLKGEYQSTIDLFESFNEEDFKQRDLRILKEFIARLHSKEMIDGQIREILAEMIFNIESNQSIVSNPARIIRNQWIIHCRCGSTYDETPLVQCYACQLWQHVSCVIIKDSFRPYYCFECHPICEEDPSSCLKMNIRISQDNQSSYSAITRSDGFLVRINECYLVEKQEKNSTSKDYDVFAIERLWIDENQTGRASGFYYLRPHETFHEANRKFFPNEIFRFPPTNESIEITSIIRPCYVLDTGTFSKGKPIAEYTGRMPSTDLFICEYRVDKLAKTFTRLPKSKHIAINTKSYCFDNYVEKLSIKRDYQSHQTPRQRASTHLIKLTAKQLEEKSSRIDGLIEKVYCQFHHPNLVPTETKFLPDQFFEQPILDRNNNRGGKRLREKNPTTLPKISKKHRSASFTDNPLECISDNNRHTISSLITELIESISSHIV